MLKDILCYRRSKTHATAAKGEQEKKPDKDKESENTNRREIGTGNH